MEEEKSRIIYGKDVFHISYILGIFLKIHENFNHTFGNRRGRNEWDRDESLFKLENNTVISLTRKF